MSHSVIADQIGQTGFAFPKLILAVPDAWLSCMCSQWHTKWFAPWPSPASGSGWQVCSFLNPPSDHSCRWGSHLLRSSQPGPPWCVKTAGKWQKVARWALAAAPSVPCIQVVTTQVMRNSRYHRHIMSYYSRRILKALQKWHTEKDEKTRKWVYFLTLHSSLTS